jgi:Rieske Fe-S protein
VLHHRQDHGTDADSPTHAGTDTEPHSRTYGDGASEAYWHCTTHRGTYDAAHGRFRDARGDVDR